MRKFNLTIVLALGATLTLAACDGGSDGPCDGVNCSGQGSCVSPQGTAACQCNAGYHAEGLECIKDAMACDGVDCSGLGTCADHNGVAACDCSDGYHDVDLTCVANGEILGTATDDEHVLSGLLADAAVVYGDFGIPNIFAANDHDAAFMAGYVHASKRLPQMHVFRLNGAGRVSELFGPVAGAAVVDYVDMEMRLVTITRDGRAISDATYDQMPAAVRERLEAYAAGVNERIAEWRDDPSDWWPQLKGLAVTPDKFPDWRPQDTLAFASYLSWDLAKGLSEELERTEYAQKLPQDIYDAIVFSRSFTGTVMIPPTVPPPPPSTEPVNRTNAPLRSLKGLRQAREHRDRVEAMRRSLGFSVDTKEASNNWVVAAQGADPSFLCNDPHLGLYAPGIWIPMSIDTKTLGDAATGTYTRGFSFGGVPLIIAGTNEKIAWGVTNSAYDVTDIWEEEVTFDGEGKPLSVTYNGAQVDVREVELSFQMGPTDSYPIETRMVYIVPHHGPIMMDSVDTDAGTALSWRWTGHDPAGIIDPWVDLPEAETLDDAFAAIQKFDVPGQNWVFATDTGDIGLYPHAWVPIRSGDLQAHPPWLVMPGTGEYEWTGRVPSDELPQARNPAAGYIATANTDINGNLLDNDPLNDAHYLYFANTIDLRAYRIAELIEPMVAAGGVTSAKMQQVQTDTHYTLAKLTVPWILTILGVAALSADAQYFADLLADWDFSTPSGLNGFITAEAVAVENQAVLEASVATTFYSEFMRQLMPLFRNDELAANGITSSPPWPAGRTPTLLALQNEAEGTETSFLWDDVSTAGVVETPQDIVVAAFEAAVTHLATLPAFADKPKEEWLWGYVHTLSASPPLYDQVNEIYNAPTYSTAAASDTVSPGNFGWPFDGNGNDFSYGSGASLRIVNTVTSTGITTKIAYPGGVTERADEEHFQDLMQQTWLPYEYVDFPGELADVLAAKEELVAFRKK